MKKDTPFGQLLFLIAMMLLGLVLAGILTACLTLVGLDTSSNYYGIIVAQTLSQLLIFLLPAYLFATRTDGRPAEFFNASPKRTAWGLCLLACLLVVLVAPAIDWASLWNDGWHFPQSLQNLESKLRATGDISQNTMSLILQQTHWAPLAINIAVIALLPAICEEFFFRGVVQQYLHRWTRNPHVAILLASAIFSLFHGELFQFVPRFAMGILLGYLFYYSKSIWVNVCAHFFNNLIVVIGSYLYATKSTAINPNDHLNIPATLTLCCFLAASALFYIYFVNRTKHINK